MRRCKIENIPNTFAPDCRNKFFSLEMLSFMMEKGFVKYKQLPKKIRQLFDEYLKSEKTYSDETRNELK